MLANVLNSFHGWSLENILVAIVLIAAGIALVVVALRVFDVWPPPWAVQVFWIVIVAFVVVVAIRLIMSM